MHSLVKSSIYEKLDDLANRMHISSRWKWIFSCRFRSQETVLHNRYFLFDTTTPFCRRLDVQNEPPFRGSGWLQCLSEMDNPLPHVLEHDVHCPHSLQLPWTGNKVWRSFWFTGTQRPSMHHLWILSCSRLPHLVPSAGCVFFDIQWFPTWHLQKT